MRYPDEALIEHQAGEGVDLPEGYFDRTIEDVSASAPTEVGAHMFDVGEFPGWRLYIGGIHAAADSTLRLRWTPDPMLPNGGARESITPELGVAGTFVQVIEGAHQGRYLTVEHERSGATDWTTPTFRFWNLGYAPRWSRPHTPVGNNVHTALAADRIDTDFNAIAAGGFADSVPTVPYCGPVEAAVVTSGASRPHDVGLSVFGASGWYHTSQRIINAGSWRFWKHAEPVTVRAHNFDTTQVGVSRFLWAVDQL